MAEEANGGAALDLENTPIFPQQPIPTTSDTMWRRACLAPWRSALRHPHAAAWAPVASSSPFLNPPHFFSSVSGEGALRRVEDVMPIATGHEREEIEAELEGKKRFDMDAPTGPFGTKEAPAVIQSYFDKRIVGCVGDEGEDEHEVIWFWLEKGKPHECPVCSQYFMLEVIGDGGDPIGQSDDEGHH